MSERVALERPRAAPHGASGRMTANRLLGRRRRSEKRFQAYALGAIVVSLSALAGLLTTIVVSGLPAFSEQRVRLSISFDPLILDPDDLGTREALADGDYRALIRNSLLSLFPDTTKRRDRRALSGLVSRGAAYTLRERVLADRSLLGRSVEIELLLSDRASIWAERRDAETHDKLESTKQTTIDKQFAWLETLHAQGRISNHFNWTFFRASDSREPEMAGIYGAFKGSLLTLSVTLLCCFPIGVGAAIYLEEFARKGWLNDFIEVNINNLAAVPSVVFGLLGLAVFLNTFNMPRSAPVVGGLVLSLMTLPTIIIAARSALKTVPPSIRDAAMAIGASPIQVVVHHILPLATPGIMTGTIIGMARALGETAPLLLIGMVAFIADAPSSFRSPSTVLPVQIFLWADAPERAFEARTSAAITVLLTFLVLMNLSAIILRRRFERRW